MTAEEASHIAAKRDQFDLIGNASRTSSFTNSPRPKRSCSGDAQPPSEMLMVRAMSNASLQDLTADHRANSFDRLSAHHRDTSFDELQDLNSGREEDIEIASRMASFGAPEDYFPAAPAAAEVFSSHPTMAPLPPATAPAPAPPTHDSPAVSPILAHATVQQAAAPIVVPLPSASVMQVAHQLAQPLENAAPALARSRKDWSEWEDNTIRATVAEVGLRWRAIASKLPGRSDDAVRNRWLRLGGEGVSKPPSAPRARKEPGEKQRQGWSAQEDAIISAAVGEIGNRWNRIAALLPNKRTEHAIRNRWHRLQTAAADGRCSVAPSDLSLQLAPSRNTSGCSVDSQMTVEDAVAPIKRGDSGPLGVARVYSC